MNFKLLNCNRHYLNVSGSQNRWLHLATIQSNIKEFICFADKFTNKIYIEEVTGGHLEFIEDESLINDINNFLIEKKILDMSKPLLSDNEWHRK